MTFFRFVCTSIFDLRHRSAANLHLASHSEELVSSGIKYSQGEEEETSASYSESTRHSPRVLYSQKIQIARHDKSKEARHLARSRIPVFAIHFASSREHPKRRDLDYYSHITALCNLSQHIGPSSHPEFLCELPKCVHTQSMLT